MMGRVVVFGSINLDLVTRVLTHPKPGETVIGSDYEMMPGGKGANQALAATNAKSDPSQVHLIGVTGNDEFAEIALANLEKSGLDLGLVNRSNTRTGIAMIAVSKSGENNIIVCPGANANTNSSQLSKMDFSINDVLLTQQEVQLKEVWLAHSFARKTGAIVVHNAAPAASIPITAFENIDYLVINASEANSLGEEFGLIKSDAETIAAQISEKFDIAVILTLGEIGAISIVRNEKKQYPSVKTEVVDTTGAGDVFCGTFAASISDGETMMTAIESAIAAASKSCATFGAQGIDQT